MYAISLHFASFSYLCTSLRCAFFAVSFPRIPAKSLERSPKAARRGWSGAIELRGAYLKTPSNWLQDFVFSGSRYILLYFTPLFPPKCYIIFTSKMKRRRATCTERRRPKYSFLETLHSTTCSMARRCCKTAQRFALLTHSVYCFFVPERPSITERSRDPSSFIENLHLSFSNTTLNTTYTP